MYADASAGHGIASLETSLLERSALAKEMDMGGDFSLYMVVPEMYADASAGHGIASLETAPA